MSLLYKPLESITHDDLQALIDNQVGESQYIEYKTEVFAKRDERKKLQFLGTVSGFANAGGGDILVGVAAENGLPVELIGLDPTEVDSEILRIRQVVGTGIEPNLMIHFWAVPLPPGRRVLIIRVPRSWSAPHGIEQDSHFKFFQRHAAGRSPMTLSELRTAFTLSAGIIQRIKGFRAERIGAITAVEGPWGYGSKPLAILHVVPFAGSVENSDIDLSKALSFRNLSPLPADRGFIAEGDLRYNLDGVLMRQGVEWHTQLFRNGSVEYATTHFFELHTLDAWMLQINILTILRRLFALQRDLGVTPPVIVMLTMLNVANFRLRISEGHSIFGNVASKNQIDRDRISLADVVFSDFGSDLIATLKPCFDSLWNAAGEARCNFYNASGWNVDPSWLDPPES